MSLSYNIPPHLRGFFPDDPLHAGKKIGDGFVILRRCHLGYVGPHKRERLILAWTQEATRATTRPGANGGYTERRSQAYMGACAGVSRETFNSYVSLFSEPDGRWDDHRRLDLSLKNRRRHENSGSRSPGQADNELLSGRMWATQGNDCSLGSGDEAVGFHRASDDVSSISELAPVERVARFLNKEGGMGCSLRYSHYIPCACAECRSKGLTQCQHVYDPWPGTERRICAECESKLGRCRHCSSANPEEDEGKLCRNCERRIKDCQHCKRKDVERLAHIYGTEFYNPEAAGCNGDQKVLACIHHPAHPDASPCLCTLGQLKLGFQEVCPHCGPCPKCKGTRQDPVAKTTLGQIKPCSGCLVCCELCDGSGDQMGNDGDRGKSKCLGCNGKGKVSSGNRGYMIGVRYHDGKWIPSTLGATTRMVADYLQLRGIRNPEKPYLQRIQGRVKSNGKDKAPSGLTGEANSLAGGNSLIPSPVNADRCCGTMEGRAAASRPQNKDKRLGMAEELGINPATFYQCRQELEWLGYLKVVPGDIIRGCLKCGRQFTGDECRCGGWGPVDATKPDKLIWLPDVILGADIVEAERERFLAAGASLLQGVQHGSQAAERLLKHLDRVRELVYKLLDEWQGKQHSLMAYWNEIRRLCSEAGVPPPLLQHLFPARE